LFTQPDSEPVLTGMLSKPLLHRAGKNLRQFVASYGLIHGGEEMMTNCSGKLISGHRNQT
jgi:hypothetical protein